MHPLRVYDISKVLDGLLHEAAFFLSKSRLVSLSLSQYDVQVPQMIMIILPSYHDAILKYTCPWQVSNEFFDDT